MKNNARESFTSGSTAFLATLGSAVGLGNIWLFPYLTGESGGAAFIIVYLLCVSFVGLPVMISEFYLGRHTKKNAVGAFNALKPKTPWPLVGYMGIISSYLIMFFYSCVAGWVYFYIFKALKGDFMHVNTSVAALEFQNIVTNPVTPILWQFIVIFIVGAIIYCGVEKGIEKVTKTLMPILFVLIVICDIRAVTLPGALKGFRFLFKHEFSKITATILLTALGLAFFKLSLGMGTMLTYGSYFTRDNNMIKTSVNVALSDTIVSLLAGIAIFPTVFTFGMNPASGKGLLFVTIPLVFSKISFGNVLLVAFFLLSAIAATTAMVSMMEVPVAYFIEEKHMKRHKAILINAAIVAAFGVTASLSADKACLLGGFNVLGDSFYNVFNNLSSNWLLPIGGFFIVVFMGYFNKRKDIENELTNYGELNNKRVIGVYYVLMKYITPVLILIVFLNTIGIIKF